MSKRPSPQACAARRTSTMRRLMIELPALTMFVLALALVVAIMCGLASQEPNSDGIPPEPAHPPTAASGVTKTARSPAPRKPAPAQTPVVALKTETPRVAGKPDKLIPPPQSDRRLREFRQACRELDEELNKFVVELEASQAPEDMGELRVLRRVYGVSSFLRELAGWLESPSRRKQLKAEHQAEFVRLVQRSRELEKWTVTFSQTQE